MSTEYEPKIALDWSILAMCKATERINKVSATDPSCGFAAIGEAVWWITIVRDSMRNTDRARFDAVLRKTTPDPTDMLLGLRSVRNRIGHEVDLVDFVKPVASRPDPGDGNITAWCWQDVDKPSRGNMTEKQYNYAMKTYQAYKRMIVPQEGNVVHTFSSAINFLKAVHSQITD